MDKRKSDTNHIDKQITKDTTGTSKLGKSSQYTRPSPSKS